MVLKVMKFFRGYLFVRLTGYSPERFFNLCGNADIVLWKIEPAEDGYTFFVSLPAFRKLKPMLRKSGTRVTILKRVGVPFLLYRYRHHRFFFIGLGSLFAILFLMTQFIWAVEISGNSSYSGQVLRDFLAESGIGYGSWKRSIDCEKTETLLRRKFDDITWVSARISGTRLYVDIQERLMEQNRPESADEAGDMATDLVTDVGGAVESIVVRKGTPLVMQGDLVEPGTIVVSGSLPLENDSGEISGYEYCSSVQRLIIKMSFLRGRTYCRSLEKNGMVFRWCLEGTRCICLIQSKRTPCALGNIMIHGLDVIFICRFN